MNYAVVRQPPMGIKYTQSTPVSVEVLEVGALHCINGLLCEPAGWLTGRVSLFTALTVPDVAIYPYLPRDLVPQQRRAALVTHHVLGANTAFNSFP